MVPHALPHPGQVVDHRYAELPEVAGRTHAGEHENVRRADGAAAEDDLIALHLEDLAAAFELDAGGPVAFKDHPEHGAVGPYGQVEPVPRQVQVAEGRAQADAVGVVQRHWADAGRVGMVQIGSVWKARLRRGSIESLLIGPPLRLREPAADYRPVGIMEIAAAEFGVGLHLPEVVEQVLVTPLVVSHFGPRVVVLRVAP